MLNECLDDPARSSCCALNFRPKLGTPRGSIRIQPVWLHTLIIIVVDERIARRHASIRGVMRFLCFYSETLEHSLRLCIRHHLEARSHFSYHSIRHIISLVRRRELFSNDQYSDSSQNGIAFWRFSFLESVSNAVESASVSLHTPKYMKNAFNLHTPCSAEKWGCNVVSDCIAWCFCSCKLCQLSLSTLPSSLDIWHGTRNYFQPEYHPIVKRKNLRTKSVDLTHFWTLNWVRILPTVNHPDESRRYQDESRRFFKLMRNNSRKEESVLYSPMQS